MAPPPPSATTTKTTSSPLVVWSELRRVLNPGGRFVYLGVHPCFGAPAVERRPGEPALLHPEYRLAGWQTESRHFSPTGIRSRVGINHLPLNVLPVACEQRLAAAARFPP